MIGDTQPRSPWRRWIKLAIAGAVGLALLGGAGFVWSNTRDLSRYQDRIVDHVRKVTGRELASKGPLRIDLNWKPQAVAEGVVLRNAAWGSRPDMVRVRKVTLQLDLVSLLLGDLKIGRVVLEGADLLVERSEAGESNLDMAPPPDGSGPHPSENRSLRHRSTPLLPWVGTIEVRESTLTIRDAPDVPPLVIGVERLVATGQSSTAPLTVDLVGRIDGGAVVRLAGRGGSFEGWLRGLPGELDLKGGLGAGTLAIKGSVNSKGMNLAGNADGPDLAALGAFARLPLPSTGPYEAATKIQTTRSGYKIELVQLKVGGSELKGELGFRTDKFGRRVASGQFESARIDLADLRNPPPAAPAPPERQGSLPGGLIGTAHAVPPPQTAQAPGGPAAPQGAPPPAGAPKAPPPKGGPTGPGGPRTATGPRNPATPPTVAPGAGFDVIPVDLLKRWNVSVTFKVGEIVGTAVKLSNASLGIGLNGGKLAIRPSATVGTGSIDLDFRYDATQTVPEAQITGSVSRVPVEDLATLAGAPALFKGAVVDIDLPANRPLKGRGRTVRDVLGSLAGSTVTVGLTGGTLPKAALDWLAPEWQRLLGLTSSGQVAFSCLATQFEFQRGVASVNKLLFETPKAIVAGAGYFNLRTDTMDLLLVPEARETALLASAVPLRVKGSLAKASSETDLETMKAMGRYYGPRTPPSLVGPMAAAAKAAAGNGCAGLRLEQLRALRGGLYAETPKPPADRPRRPPGR